MKLYGHYISLTTLQVLQVLKEKRLTASYEQVDVMSKEQKAPAHLARHPFGHIPVLDDEGFVLYETHAIVRYLDSLRAENPLVPAGVRERARMDQWLCIEQNYLVPAAKKRMSRDYAKMMERPDPGPQPVEEGTQELRHCIGQFARFVGGRPSYIAGDAPSLADFIWAADLLEMSRSATVAEMLDDRVKL